MHVKKIFNYFLMFYLFLRESMGAEREGDRGSKAGSVLTAASLIRVLKSQDHDLSQSRCSTDWATQAPLKLFLKIYSLSSVGTVEWFRGLE